MQALIIHLVMRFDHKIVNWIYLHKIKTGFIVAFVGVCQYFGVYPWLISKLTWKESFSKKLRRWILGERNLPPDSIKEAFYKVHTDGLQQSKFSDFNRMRLELVFEDWDSKLQFGVSYWFIEKIFKSFGLLETEKDVENFFQQSGYYREVDCISQRPINTAAQ